MSFLKVRRGYELEKSESFDPEHAPNAGDSTVEVEHGGR
ncbi:hypothetical protein J2853_008608 [Streptosporangium lutulentum]|uniref:Uncharacterized protein n=1 Tax=Streptosporangium lutulentum TaxID=1461250 RepID=A0ABT9QRM5_9ACTN|nr:hypothetical protein [Streptosporangium lutulentum]